MSNRPDLIGREVVIHFASGQPISGVVTYTPCATGDCWLIKREPSEWEPAGEWLVQQFEWMEVKPPGEGGD